jgi:hypothetical protein
VPSARRRGLLGAGPLDGPWPSCSPASRHGTLARTAHVKLLRARLVASALPLHATRTPRAATRRDATQNPTSHDHEAKPSKQSKHLSPDQPRAREEAWALGQREMVFSASFVAAAARVPAELCQRPPRPGRWRRRLSADDVLRALFLPPVRELGRLGDFLFAFFCLPLPEYYLPGSGRGGGWVARVPDAVLYTYRRSLSVSSSSSSSSFSSSSSEEDESLIADEE